MEYRIIRSRRKTVAIEITPQGNILVRCPNRMPRRQIHAFVESKAGWIRNHLEKFASRPHAAPMPPEQHQALIRSAKAYLPDRVRFWSGQTGISCGRITIRSQHTRWGSCSASGSLSFNCLLMLAPEDVRDYVIVHELCHRMEMNHSPRFWAQVESILPGYRVQKQWLKENGAFLLEMLPEY